MKASVLVTAGPTREPIDPVRFISNRSTGTFGYALAREARRRGCRTTLVSGPVALAAPSGVRRIMVETAHDMDRAVRREFPRHTCLIMAAAVADWRMARPGTAKLKAKNGLVLRLVPNPDIVKAACKGKKDRIVAGFALETGDLAANAARKLKEKNLDLIIANRTGRGASAFGEGLKDVTILDRRGGCTRYRGRTKAALAKIILDKVLTFNI